MRGTRCRRGRCGVIAGIVGAVGILLYLTLQLDDEGHVTFNFLTHSQVNINKLTGKYKQSHR